MSEVRVDQIEMAPKCSGIRVGPARYKVMRLEVAVRPGVPQLATREELDDDTGVQERCFETRVKLIKRWPRNVV